MKIKEKLFEDMYYVFNCDFSKEYQLRYLE